MASYPFSPYVTNNKGDNILDLAQWLVEDHNMMQSSTGNIDPRMIAVLEAIKKKIENHCKETKRNMYDYFRNSFC